jgi:hypothetical protein|tara:strand:+ start:228 stop:371 length:144 start_codon:yes stop_codon:yes gene_type:complete
MEIILFIAGGLAGLYQARSTPADGLAWTFLMGVLLYGGILNLIYLIF